MYTGDQIRKYRKKAGLTQKELGRRLGISQQQIGQWETGKTNPKIETLQKIADVLGESLFMFLDDELFDVATDDKDFDTNHVSEVLDRRIKEVAENPALSRDEKLKQLNDLITSGNIIIHERINHVTIAKKQLLNFYFDELNIDGQNRALDHVEMLTKISDFRKDMVSDVQILDPDQD